MKRRADVVGTFPNEGPIIRLIGAVLLEANDERQTRHRYMQTKADAAAWFAREKRPQEAPPEAGTGWTAPGNGEGSWRRVAGRVEPQSKLIHVAVMSNALHVPPRLTVAEFQDWSPPAGLDDRRWHLVDGEASCMAPTSENHGAIQSEAAYLITQHLRSVGSRCRVITTPGVIPRVRSALNERIPDLGVTCSAPSGAKAIVDPLVLIEILSPSNEAQTRANVWAYTTIPTVVEILLLSSTSVSGELWRREPDGTWADNPQPLDAEGDVRLECLGFAAPMPAFYATTSLL